MTSLSLVNTIKIINTINTQFYGFGGPAISNMRQPMPLAHIRTYTRTALETALQVRCFPVAMSNLQGTKTQGGSVKKEVP